LAFFTKLFIAKQSPSQSPALNNAHFPGNTMGSPVIGNSPHLAGSRIGSDYAGKHGLGFDIILCIINIQKSFSYES
jgi:hypothetical protein